MIFYTYFDDASTGNTQISAIKNINPNQKDNPILSRVLLAMTPQIKQWGRIGRTEGYTDVQIPLPLSVSGKKVTAVFLPEADATDQRTAKISGIGTEYQVIAHLSDSLSVNWVAICH